MGRRKNNPGLVSELIDGLFTMGQDEFEEKYNSLSSSDRYEVIDAIDNMENEWIDDSIPEGCAACGNPAYPKCMISCNMFDD